MIYKKQTIVSVAVQIALMAVFSGYVISNMPPDAVIPVHWNAMGEVDGVASPLLAILMLIIPKLETRQKNLAQSHKLLAVSWLGTTLFLTVLHFAIGLIGLGYDVPIMALIYLGVGLLFMAVGNMFGKSHSNYHVGIRTPWTLASDVVWDKTHRLAGRLWVLAGLVIAISGLILPPQIATVLVIITALTASLAPVFASYIFWRKKPVDLDDST
jgi:uncharacterized membrane protein